MNLKAGKIFYYVRPFADYKNNYNYNLSNPTDNTTYIYFYFYFEATVYIKLL